MNRTLTKLAAAGALSLCAAAPALAGSVTQPGETVGLNTGAPLPQGWYVINTVDWGCRNTNPQHTCTGSHHSGRRLVNAVDDFGRETTVRGGWPAVEVGVQRDPGLGLPGTYFNGLYNPLVSGNWPGTSAMDGL